MSVFQAIFYYFSIYRRFIGRRVYIVFILTIAVALAEGLGITLLLPLLDLAGVADANEEKGYVAYILSEILGFIGIDGSIVGVLVFIGVVFILKGVLKFGEGSYLSYLKSRLLKEIQGKMFNAYTKMNYEYYSKNNTGHFINIIGSQIAMFIGSFTRFKSFISTIIMALAYFIISFILAWQFATMAVVVGVVLLMLFKRLNEFVKNLSRQVASESGTLHKYLVQSLQAFKYLVSTAHMGYLKDGVFKSINRLSSYEFKRGMANSFTAAIKEPISILFLLGIIIIQITVFQAPVAPIFVALLLFHRGMDKVVGIQSDWQKTLTNIGSLEMVVKEFEDVSSVEEQNGSINVQNFRRSIDFKNVYFAYDIEDGDVLKNININIPLNKTIAFVGESGAGKSTLIDMITLMLRPRSGKVLIDGIPGEDIKRETWRSQIGYVSQETVVFDDTVANNISLWKGDYENDPEIQDCIREAAKKAYALDFIENLPKGFNTIVGDRGIRLSGGQRQRLFIARELFKEPNLLILDEATSALDSESESYIQQSIDNLRGSITVVIIAHRLSTIKSSDYIYVLDNGCIIEHGSFKELSVVNDGRFRQMVDMQSL